MKHLRLALVVAAVAAGGLVGTQFEYVSARLQPAGYEVSPFRREACREAQLGPVEQAPAVALMGTSRLWAALEDDFAVMPVCARRALTDASGQAVAETYVSLGLRDISVLYDDVDPLEPDLLIIESELLATTPFVLSLSARRQALASQWAWQLESMILGAPEPRIRRHGAPPCAGCFEPKFVQTRVDTLDRNLADTPALRPHHEELFRARAAAGKRTVLLELPRSPALESAAAGIIEPWRAYFRELAAQDPALSYWSPARGLVVDDFYDEAHVGERGRRVTRAWLLEQIAGARGGGQ